jgi:hypothetical protein
MQFQVVRATRFVRVEVKGPADVGAFVQGIQALAADTLAQGDKLLLVNLLQVEESLDSTGHFVLGEQVARLLSHLSRLASVVPPARMTRTSEKVARAHGVQLRVFDAEPPALAWLLDVAGVPEPAANADGSLMDPIRCAFWDAYRHLFPPNAQAIQLSNGNLVIAWALARDPQALFEMSTPVTVRFEPELLASMAQASAVQRRRIAASQEMTFRAGLLGYDPYARVPQARVIVLG